MRGVNSPGIYTGGICTFALPPGIVDPVTATAVIVAKFLESLANFPHDELKTVLLLARQPMQRSPEPSHVLYNWNGRVLQSQLFSCINSKYEINMEII